MGFALTPFHTESRGPATTGVDISQPRKIGCECHTLDRAIVGLLKKEDPILPRRLGTHFSLNQTRDTPIEFWSETNGWIAIYNELTAYNTTNLSFCQ